MRRVRKIVYVLIAGALCVPASIAVSATLGESSPLVDAGVARDGVMISIDPSSGPSEVGVAARLGTEFEYAARGLPFPDVLRSAEIVISTRSGARPGIRVTWRRPDVPASFDMVVVLRSEGEIDARIYPIATGQPPAAVAAPAAPLSDTPLEVEIPVRPVDTLPSTVKTDLPSLDVDSPPRIEPSPMARSATAKPAPTRRTQSQQRLSPALATERTARVRGDRLTLTRDAGRGKVGGGAVSRGVEEARYDAAVAELDSRLKELEGIVERMRVMAKLQDQWITTMRAELDDLKRDKVLVGVAESESPAGSATRRASFQPGPATSVAVLAGPQAPDRDADWKLHVLVATGLIGVVGGVIGGVTAGQRRKGMA